MENFKPYPSPFIEAEEAQRIETNIYRDKLENVQLERENMVFDAKVDSMALSNLVHNKHALTEIELCTELQELRANVKAEELNKQSCIQELQLKQNMELMELNNKYEDKCREVDKIMTLEDEMDTRVKEIKIRKNRELERATELNAHNVACELKKKDKWKEELENANKLAQRQERKHLAAKNENKRLTEAIQKAELMKIHLLMDLEEYEKYKVKQRANQGRLNKLKKERHQQKVEKELLLQANYTSFESLVLNLSHTESKTCQPVIFAIIYRPPGPYSEFLAELSEFILNLVLSSDKILIVGDFNIHVDKDSDSLSSAFMSLIDSVGFFQTINEATHRLN
uniref:Endonuclease/exonuclease/phosphatase domain-containing protein n=1 Tax=Gouania willdenowi TaxID=441366 RepID=A0A8C5D3Y3_GOUWI